jgi:hypothetical protein
MKAGGSKTELCLAYSLTLKKEVTCSSKTSTDFQLTTQWYIPEERNLYLLINISIIWGIFVNFSDQFFFGIWVTTVSKTLCFRKLKGDGQLWK